MGRIANVPLTEFVKDQVIKLVQGGAKLKTLQSDFGMSSGYLSLLRAGKTGVGPGKGAGIARMLSFKNYAELCTAAQKWWDESGRSAYETIQEPETHPDPEIAAAITGALALGATQEAIARALAKFSAVTGKDRWWWAQQIGDEMQSIEKPLREETTTEKKAATARAQGRKKIRDAAAELEERRKPKVTKDHARQVRQRARKMA